MKLILEFSEEERDEARIAFNAQRWYATVAETDRWLRDQIKYQELDETTAAAYQKVRDTIWESLNEFGLSIYD